MKKLLVFIVVVAAILFGVYYYYTRPVAAPAENIQDVTPKLPAGSATSSVYRISSVDSKVEFDINEKLYNKAKLVIGTTDQIAGDIAVSNDSKLQVGELKIAASTFVTDSTQRNGALARLILHSDQAANAYIVFKPTSNDIVGSVKMGTPMTFSVSGDLTISGVAKPATFKVTATITDSSIIGVAETTVNRSDYNLVIPSLSFVANVDESFPVKLNIVAKRIMQ